MTYLGAYEIELLHNGVEVELTPRHYSFSMIDSIHSIYSRASMSVNDYTGFFQEYLGTAEGNIVELRFGVGDKMLSCPYVVTEDSNPDPDTPKGLTGRVDVNFVHEWHNRQTQSSRSYSGRISDVITQIVNEYPFEPGVVNDTSNNDFWLQGQRTQARFITDVLLKNAYSLNADGTPFYAFIDSKNRFNLRNLKSMLYDAKDAFTYIVRPASTEDPKVYYQTVMGIRRWKRGSRKLWKLRHVQTNVINRDSGALDQDQVDLATGPVPNGRLPILNDEDGTTGSAMLGYAPVTTAEQENVQGQLANLLRDGAFIDEFMLIVPFNPTLTAGSKIRLEVPAIVEMDGEELSRQYTGSYLIELCEHVWNGEEEQAFTKLLIGRKYVSLPENYSLGQRMMGNTG